MAELHALPRNDAAAVQTINPERRYLGLADAGHATGLSKSYIHQQVMAGQLKAFRVGKRILIATDDLETFIRRIPA